MAVPPNSVPFGVNSEAVSTLICVIAGLAFCKNGGKPFTVMLGSGIASTVPVIRDERSSTRPAWITDPLDPAPCCTATSWPTIMSAGPAKEKAEVFKVPTRLSIAKVVPLLIATSTSLPIAGPEAAGVSCRTTMLNCAGKLPVATTTPSISGRAVLLSSKKISVATSVLFACRLMFTDTISLAAMHAKPTGEHTPAGKFRYCVLELVVML